VIREHEERARRVEGQTPYLERWIIEWPTWQFNTIFSYSVHDTILIAIITMNEEKQRFGVRYH